MAWSIAYFDVLNHCLQNAEKLIQINNLRYAYVAQFVIKQMLL